MLNALQVDRSIENLQSKFKELKRIAKKQTSEMKRDIVLTGNKKLRKSTLRELHNSDSLIALRANI